MVLRPRLFDCLVRLGSNPSLLNFIAFSCDSASLRANQSVPRLYPFFHTHGHYVALILRPRDLLRGHPKEAHEAVMFLPLQWLGQTVCCHSHAVDMFDLQQPPLGLFRHPFIANVDRSCPCLIEGVHYHLVYVETIGKQHQ